MLKLLDLFSGIGGFSLAARMTEKIQPSHFVEIDPYCQKILEKNFPGVPIHGDIRTFTTKPGSFDLFTIGFPCQDNSVANQRGEGLAGARSGLWFEAKRLIGEGRPDFAIVENVPPTQNRRWDAVVRSDFDCLGYHTEKIKLSTRATGGWHLRERVFIVAYSVRFGFQKVWDENRLSRQIALQKVFAEGQESSKPARGASGRIFRLPNTGALRVADGVSAGLDANRIKALGNAVDPRVASIPFQRILELSAQ